MQINGTGPFDVIYVDPKDDPRKQIAIIAAAEGPVVLGA